MMCGIQAASDTPARGLLDCLTGSRWPLSTLDRPSASRQAHVFGAGTFTNLLRRTRTRCPAAAPPARRPAPPAAPAPHCPPCCCRCHSGLASAAPARPPPPALPAPRAQLLMRLPAPAAGLASRRWPGLLRRLSQRLPSAGTPGTPATSWHRRCRLRPGAGRVQQAQLVKPKNFCCCCHCRRLVRSRVLAQPLQKHVETEQAPWRSLSRVLLHRHHRVPCKQGASEMQRYLVQRRVWSAGPPRCRLCHWSAVWSLHRQGAAACAGSRSEAAQSPPAALPCHPPAYRHTQLMLGKHCGIR